MPEPDLIRRQRAAAKTMAKYRKAPFAWEGAHCAPMLRSHLVAMGHKKLPKMPAYSTALGAKRALQALGFEDVAALLDNMLPRIPPARALLGDIVLMQGTAGLDAVAIAAGGGKVAGWHEDAPGMVVMIPASVIGVWRA